MISTQNEGDAMSKLTRKELNEVRELMLPAIKSARKCAVSMIEEGNRDFEVRDAFILKYTALQRAFDILSA